MAKLTIRNSFGYKDQMKADISNKFIGRGSAASSTNQYAKDYGDYLANTGDYLSTDVVFISAEGNRTGRLLPDVSEIVKACEAGATMVTDSPYNRNRQYNVGERFVADLLIKQGCEEFIHTNYSTWKSHG
jgi:hypothetical protein